jgi:hypothetical protein
MHVTNPKPLWLLDVDGVLNVGRRKNTRPPHSWPADSWVDFTGYDAPSASSWPMRVARPVVDFINSVITDDLADVAWLTTWRDSANALGATLGLPPLDVVPTPDYDRRHVMNDWWKLPPEGVFLGVRPVFWSEVVAGFFMRDADKVNFNAWPNLVVSPSTSTGLVKRDLTTIHDHLTLVRDKLRA